MDYIKSIQQFALKMYGYQLAQVVLVGIVLLITMVLLKKLIHHFFKRTDFLEERKEQTIESLAFSIINYTALFGFLFYILSLMIDVTRLLAGAGVIGIILGFGAQSLIKDILAGLFMIYEKQLHKGDFIAVNNTFTGTVEDIGIRYLKVREWSGKLLTISNGEVKQIQNYNIDRMRVIEKVVVSFHENPSKIFDVLQLACDKLNEEFGHCLKLDQADCIIEPFQLYGVTSLNSQYRGYEYTVTGLVNDDTYWTAAKETRKVIAQTLFDHRVEMPAQAVRFQEDQPGLDEK